MRLKTSLIVLVAVAASFGSVAQTPPAGVIADTIAIGGVAVPTVVAVVGGLILAAAVVSAVNANEATATATATATAP